MGLVLKNNNFEFFDQTYKQIRGTAFSSKLSLRNAILFMAPLQENIL